jgi:hypothetical protein
MRTVRAEHGAHKAGMMDAWEILVNKPEGNRQLERPRRGREDDTEMDLESNWI